MLGRSKEVTISCVVLSEEIQAMGYEGQLTILRGVVRPLRPQPKKQAILRLETPPRKQNQMGLAYVGKYLVNDTLQDVCGCRIQNSTSSQY